MSALLTPNIDWVGGISHPRAPSRPILITFFLGRTVQITPTPTGQWISYNCLNCAPFSSCYNPDLPSKWEVPNLAYGAEEISTPLHVSSPSFFYIVSAVLSVCQSHKSVLDGAFPAFVWASSIWISAIKSYSLLTPYVWFSLSKVFSCGRTSFGHLRLLSTAFRRSSIRSSGKDRPAFLSFSTTFVVSSITPVSVYSINPSWHRFR